MQKADGDRFHTPAAKLFPQAHELGARRALGHRAVEVSAFPDAEAKGGWDQMPSGPRSEIVELCAILPADMYQVGETFRGDEGCSRTLALEQRMLFEGGSLKSIRYGERVTR